MNLGVHFLYQVPLQIQNSFLDTVKNILQVLRFWNGRMLSLEGRIIILKYLLFLKIVYIVFLTLTPNLLIEELQKFQKLFIWHTSRPKSGQETLCNKFESGGL